MRTTALRVTLLAPIVLAVACARERPPAPPPPPPAPGPDAGTVFVDSRPPGLEVSAAGAARCRTPCSFRIDPGTHRLSIRAPGYMPWQEDVVVPARGEVRVSAAPVGSH